jgi:hypothetical protein
MSLTNNNGSTYYELSCGIPSTTTNLSSNNFTGFYRNSANEFVLWGQGITYTPISSNNGSANYFLKCNVPSDSGLNLVKNNGTKYYYNSAFNCVSFCDDVFYYSPSGLEWNG